MTCTDSLPHFLWALLTSLFLSLDPLCLFLSIRCLFILKTQLTVFI